MTSATVHLVVTCSNRKTTAVPAELRIATVPGESVGDRFAAWTSRLEQTACASVAAIDLYSGEHWHVARRLPVIAQGAGYPVKLWVCSAGYGLVPADALLKPYSATFARGHADSVAQTPDEARAWWRMQSAWSGPVPGRPRSLTELAARDPDSVIIAALSATYLASCGEDVLAAAGKLVVHENLSLVSAGTSPRGVFADVLCPVDGNLQGALGGTLMALNVRAVGHILASLKAELPTRTAARRVISELGAATAPVVRPRREPASDQEIRGQIAERLRAAPASCTSMLRQFRSEGRACEQSRFARLYAEAKGGN
jgi:hypothetical protein